jgi:putative ABC transport system ATP-binding protein
VLRTSSSALDAPSVNKGLAIALQGVNKTFGSGDNATHVLRNINLSLPNEAGLVFILGPSGCGKTTLISLIAGILGADKGSELWVFGQPLHRLRGHELTDFRQQHLGFVFQQFQLVPTLSVLENVSVPLLIQRVPRKKAYQQAAQMLEKVGLKGKEQALPKDLSGGQQQRVAIARALISRPKLLICDEPTSALDGPTGHAIMELLQALGKEEGRCVLIVTHDNRILSYADWLITMEDGLIGSVEAMSPEAQEQNLALNQLEA